MIVTETISIAAESYDERYPDVGPGGQHLAETNRYVPVWSNYGTPQDIYDRPVKPDGSLDGDVNGITIQKGGGARIALNGSGGR